MLGLIQKGLCNNQHQPLKFNVRCILDVQWDQCSPANSVTQCSDQIMSFRFSQRSAKNVFFYL